jgi:ubiquinone/menaquinone biosynthesis C-methylase UbiE
VTLRTCRFDDAEFDIVATNKTTHHIPEWKAVLAEIVRVLKPGGYFIYGDLVVPSWLARLGRSPAGGLAGFVIAPSWTASSANKA